MPVISASDWVRNTFVPDPQASGDKQKFIASITEYSINQLRNDPEVCIKYICKHYPDVESKKGYVLEGFRNPKDFLTLLNPSTDLVVLLKFPNNPIHGMTFEQEGLQTIYYSVEWFLHSKLMSECQVINFSLTSLDEINNIANEICKTI